MLAHFLDCSFPPGLFIPKVDVHLVNYLIPDTERRPDRLLILDDLISRNGKMSSDPQELIKRLKAVAN